MLGRVRDALGWKAQGQGQGGLEELGFAKRFLKGAKEREGAKSGEAQGEGWRALSEEERGVVAWELGQRGTSMGRVLRFFES